MQNQNVVIREEEFVCLLPPDPSHLELDAMFRIDHFSKGEMKLVSELSAE